MMKKKAMETIQAPPAVGSYSQGIQSGEWLFLSGQIPLDPVTGIMVAGDVAIQTQQIMENMQAVLASAGADFSHLVKVTIYLVNLADFPIVDRVYARYLVPPFPARATVGVAALPKGAAVEIEGVARLGKGWLD